MELTDTRIRNAKPKTKAYKLSDGGGMYLLDHAGRRALLAAGLSFRWKAPHACSWCLSNCDTFRRPHTPRRSATLLDQNIDPSAVKKATKRAAKLASDNTFRGRSAGMDREPAK